MVDGHAALDGDLAHPADGGKPFMQRGQRDCQHRLPEGELARGDQHFFRRMRAPLNLDGLKAKAGIGAGGHETGRQAATLCIGENTSGKQSGHHRAGDDDPQARPPRLPRHACLDRPLRRLQVCGAFCTGVRGGGCPLAGAHERDQSSHCAVSSR